MRTEILTRETLLLRLRDRGDQESWDEFVELYTPLLYSYCRRRGLEHPDASDVVQEVMRSVSVAMGNFEYDPEKGKFKGYLFTAVRNAISSHFRRKARQPCDMLEPGALEGLPADPGPDDEERWDEDYRKQLMAWALEKIRGEFVERIWKAFEGTALELRSAADVGAELGMSANAVGVAKHRVVTRLREKVQSVDAEKWEMEMVFRGK